MRIRGTLSQLFAVVLVAVALPAAAQYQGDAAGTPVPVTPVAKPPGDQAVIDDIERTLRGLSGVTVGARRIQINQPAAARRTDVTVPSMVELAAGKSVNIDLPGDARDIVVGDPTVADVAIMSKRRLFVIGRKAGRTNIFVLDSNGQAIARTEVAVGVDVDAVRSVIRRVMPDENVQVEAQGASLILTGTVLSDAAIGRVLSIVRQFVTQPEQLVNLVTVSREQQVLIQVKVAEVQRSVVKQLGFNTTVGNKAPIFGPLNITGSFVNTVASPSGTFTFNGIRDVLSVLEVLETNGLVRNLAEPNLVAVSGEIAAMLAGGEMPVPVSDNDGIAVQYKPFGVTLSFLPVIMDGGRINMKLTTEVSSVNAARTAEVAVVGGTATYSSFDVRRASSTVELPNGGALMIAGLIQNDMTANLNGVPGLMDIPVLGALFRSQQFQRNETELVVIVTATLVKPTGPGTLVSPTDSIAPGGDLDFWLFGKILGRHAPGFPQDRVLGRPDNQLPVGFLLDEVAK